LVWINKIRFYFSKSSINSKKKKKKGRRKRSSVVGLGKQNPHVWPILRKAYAWANKVSSPSKILNFFYLKMGQMTCHPAQKSLKNNKVRQCVTYFPLISVIIVVEKSRFMVFWPRNLFFNSFLYQKHLLHIDKPIYDLK
jgi:hypothetical protein